ncbi:DNA polymerase III subunit delta' [Dokdonella sp.]|uniref:DNA polymerase III subunit delta' n=1 Tax=Dokdonella sp. TaxID=2291710 RepID=UPI003529655B
MKLQGWLGEHWRVLATRLQRNELPHAVLICGDAGLGKRSLANALASAALCEARQADGHACGICKSCQLLTAGSHPDHILVGFEARDDGKLRSEITVEQIRQLSQRLSLSTQYGGLQIVIIDPADKMNTSAANALLKTLEEPSASTVIVLVSDHPAHLSATIRSRCQRIELKVPERARAMEWLVEQGISIELAEQALESALGNPGEALGAISNEVLGLRGECARDLLELNTARTSALTVADAWAADRPAERLWHAAVIARDEALRLADGKPGKLGLTGAGEIPKLAAWFAAANRSRELLNTQLRSELVVLDLLHAWQMPRRP